MSRLEGMGVGHDIHDIHDIHVTELAVTGYNYSCSII